MHKNVKNLLSQIRQIVTLVGCVLAIEGQFAPAHAQGIPVISVSELAQDLVMAKNLQSQLVTMTDQYNALTGNRGFGQILNNPSLTSYLPSQWQSVYSQVKSGQLQGLSSAAQQIESQEGMTANTPSQQRYNDTLATNKAMATQAYQASADRLQNIQNLMQQSDLTQDPAAKADLQNRLLSENAMIQNEQTKLNLMGQLQQAEEKLAEKQDADTFKNTLMGSASQTPQ
jgi:type IV secretion system protein VirB5